MKHLALLLLAGLLCAAGLSAQSLEGKWAMIDVPSEVLYPQQSENQDPDFTIKSVYTVIFTFQNGNYTLNEKTRSEHGFTGQGLTVLGSSGSHHGQYEVTDGILHLIPAKEKPVARGSADDNTTQYIGLNAVLSLSMTSAMRKMEIRRMTLDCSFRIISLTETELTLEEILAPKRKRWVKEPLTFTLTRQ